MSGWCGEAASAMIPHMADSAERDSLLAPLIYQLRRHYCARPELAVGVNTSTQPTMTLDATPVRVLTFIKKDPRITSEQFQRYWREVHAPKFLEYMRKYGVQFYSQTYMTKHDKDAVNEALFEGSATTLEYDGIATVVFSSMENARLYWKDPGHMRIMQEDADFLTQGGRKMCISSGEERIILST